MFRTVVSAVLSALVFLCAPSMLSAQAQPNSFEVNNWHIADDTSDGRRDLTLNFTDLVLEKTDVMPATFDPPISGFWVAKDEKSLQFTPTQNWAPCTLYKVNINPKLKSKNNLVIQGTKSFSFTHRPLKVTKFNDTYEDDNAIVMEFSNFIAPSDLVKYLTLADEKGNKLQWSPMETAVVTKVRLKLAESLKKYARVDYTLTKGLMPAQGNVGMENVQTGSIKLVEEFDVTKLTGVYTRKSGNILRLVTSRNSSPTNDFKSLITVTPSVDFSVETADSSINLIGDFKSEQHYTVSVAPELFCMSDGLKCQLGTTATLEYTFPAPMAVLELPNGNGWFSTAGTMRLPVRAEQIIKPVEVTAYRVYDNNYPVFTGAFEEANGVSQWGEKIATIQVPVVQGSADIDLKALLGSRTAGTYEIRVKGEKATTGNSYTFSPDSDSEDDEGNYSEWASPYGSDLSVSTMLTLTNLALVAKEGAGTVTVWAGDMNTALSKSGVVIELYSLKNQKLAEGVTDAQGLVTFTGQRTDAEDFDPFLVLARHDRDITYLKLSETQTWSENFPGTGAVFPSAKGWQAYVTTDRGAYRSGEVIHLLALLRDKAGTAAKASIPVQIRVLSPKESEVLSKTQVTDSDGRLDTTISLPMSQASGNYKVQLAIPDETRILGEAEVFIGEFMPNRIRVKASTVADRVPANKPFEIFVSAEEMFGAPATGRMVSASVTYTTNRFRPAGFEQYTFGDATAKWDDTEKELGNKSADAEGKAVFSSTPPLWSPTGMLKANIQTSVADSGRSVSNTTSTIVDTAPYYLGAKTSGEGFLPVGQNSTFDIAVVTAQDGQLYSPTSEIPLNITVYREQWNSALKKTDTGYRYESSLELVPVTTGTVTLGATGRTQWSFTPIGVGAYRFKVATAAMAQDVGGNKREELSAVVPFTVSSGTWDSAQPWSLKEPESVQVSLDREYYSPGDVAKILIKSPFPGTAIIGFEQDTPLTVTVAQMETNTLELPITVPENFRPQAWVSVTVLRPVTPEASWLPHRAVGYAPLKITPQLSELIVGISSANEVRPGSDLPVQISVTDAQSSAPVSNANVQLWGVDEGLLTLTDFELLNPIDWLSRLYKLETNTSDFYSKLVPDILKATNPKTQGGDGNGGKKFVSVQSKDRVKPFAVWLGKLQTDASGVTSGTFAVPSEFNGSFELMAVVDTAEKMGADSKKVAVKAPIIVQNNAPRFLACGDTAEMSYTIFNTTSQETTVQLSLSTEGPVTLSNQPNQEVVIPAGTSRIVALNVQAASSDTGVASFVCRATSPVGDTVNTLSLPVRSAAPRVSWSSIAQVSPDGTAQKLSLSPINSIVSGTLEIHARAGDLAPAKLQGAIQANLFYPYGCLEQTVSRALPLLAIEQTGLAETMGYSRAYLRQNVQDGINRLPLYQSYRLLGMWPQSDEGVKTDRFTTAYALMLLCAARDAGYSIPNNMIASLGNGLYQDAKYESTGTDDVEAFIYYVSVCAGMPDRVTRGNLLKQTNVMASSGLAWLAAALHAEGQTALSEKTLALAVKNMAGGVVPADKKAQTPYSSVDRERAVVLWAMMKCYDAKGGVPPEALVIARAIEDAKRKEAWDSTQANAWSVMALASLQKVLNQTEPADFTGTLAAGSTVLNFSHRAPAVLENAPDTVSVSAFGKGVVGVSWYGSAIPSMPLPAVADGGLGVTHRLLDRTGKPANMENIKVGDLFVVELDMRSASDLDSVVVQDLLPACFEIEDSNLRTATQVAAALVEMKDNKWNTDFQDIRDDRMLVFGSLNATGKNEQAIIRYTVRAVTPGMFALPSVQVEDMYNPGIKARSEPGKIKVHK